MTLKEFLKRFDLLLLLSAGKKSNIELPKKMGLILYPSIFLIAFVIYSITFNSINNQKNENEKNLEKFFDSEEFTNIKGSFFENLKSPYLEFNYNIENNDSVDKNIYKLDNIKKYASK